jgi:glutaredoxin-dependent peroxiredoxin
MALQVGDPAPDFALSLTPGEAPLRLSDYLGEHPVVLLFFPLAFSPACTDEMFLAADRYESLKKAGARVVAISVDSPFVTERFANECGVAFPIVSDFNREAAEDYDVLLEDFFGLEGVARRAVFVVDRDGRIAYVWESDPDGSEQPDMDRVQAEIERVS